MQQPYMSQPSSSCLVERILGRREKKISGFPCSSVGKESGRNAGDLGSIPGSGRSPGDGNGNTLQYFCLENPMDRGTWQATVEPGRLQSMGSQESDMTERLERDRSENITHSQLNGIAIPDGMMVSKIKIELQN